MRRILAIALLMVVSPSLGADDPPAMIQQFWAESPTEVRIVFDRPIEAIVATSLVGQSIPYFASITFLASIEVRPQLPILGELKITAARLVDDDRTIVLTTDPHPDSAFYFLPASLKKHLIKGVRQYTLTGVLATWDDGREGSAPEWSGRLPGLNFDENLEPMKASPNYKHLVELLAKPGRLTIKGRFATSPGKVIVFVQGTGPYRATFNGEAALPVGSVGRILNPRWPSTRTVTRSTSS